MSANHLYYELPAAALAPGADKDPTLWLCAVCNLPYANHPRGKEAGAQTPPETVRETLQRALGLGCLHLRPWRVLQLPTVKLEGGEPVRLNVCPDCGPAGPEPGGT